METSERWMYQARRILRRNRPRDWAPIFNRWPRNKSELLWTASVMVHHVKEMALQEKSKNLRCESDNVRIKWCTPLLGFCTGMTLLIRDSLFWLQICKFRLWKSIIVLHYSTQLIYIIYCMNKKIPNDQQLRDLRKTLLRMIILHQIDANILSPWRTCAF